MNLSKLIKIINYNKLWFSNHLNRRRVVTKTLKSYTQIIKEFNNGKVS